VLPILPLLRRYSAHRILTYEMLIGTVDPGAVRGPRAACTGLRASDARRLGFSRLCRRVQRIVTNLLSLHGRRAGRPLACCRLSVLQSFLAVLSQSSCSDENVTPLQVLGGAVVVGASSSVGPHSDGGPGLRVRSALRGSPERPCHAEDWRRLSPCGGPKVSPPRAPHGRAHPPHGRHCASRLPGGGDYFELPGGSDYFELPGGGDYGTARPTGACLDVPAAHNPQCMIRRDARRSRAKCPNMPLLGLARDRWTRFSVWPASRPMSA